MTRKVYHGPIPGCYRVALFEDSGAKSGTISIHTRRQRWDVTLALQNLAIPISLSNPLAIVRDDCDTLAAYEDLPADSSVFAPKRAGRAMHVKKEAFLEVILARILPEASEWLSGAQPLYAGQLRALERGFRRNFPSHVRTRLAQAPFAYVKTDGEFALTPEDLGLERSRETWVAGGKGRAIGALPTGSYFPDYRWRRFTSS